MVLSAVPSLPTVDWRKLFAAGLTSGARVGIFGVWIFESGKSSQSGME